MFSLLRLNILIGNLVFFGNDLFFYTNIHYEERSCIKVQKEQIYVRFASLIVS